jgi:hypothetical protein
MGKKSALKRGGTTAADPEILGVIDLFMPSPIVFAFGCVTASGCTMIQAFPRVFVV